MRRQTVLPVVLVLLAALAPVAQARSAGRPGVAVATTAAVATVLSSTPDDTFVTNGPVNVVLRSGDTVYLGGRFDRVGPRTGPGVEVTPDGVRIAASPQVSGSGLSAILGAGGNVTAVAPDGAGGWYVGGLFTTIGGVARSNLAHLLADRTVDPAFAPEVNDGVRNLVVTGSRVHLAGGFTSVNGVVRNRLAAVDRVTGALLAFDPDADAPVEAMTASADGSLLYVGGRFTRVGGLPRVSLAALDAVTGRATPTFAAAVTGTIGAGVVSALAVTGSTLYVGGSFTSVGGLPRTNLAALRLGFPLDGLPLQTFDATPARGTCAACGSVSALAASGGTVYAGGFFDTIGGQRRTGLAALDGTTGLASAFDPAPDGTVFALTVAGPTLYAAGSFRTVSAGPGGGRVPRDRAAAYRTTDGTPTAFDIKANGTAAAIAVGPSSVYVGGSFSSLGGVARKSIAALSAVDGTVLDFDPGADGPGAGSGLVQALAVSGGRLYVGGRFGTLGGAARASLGAVDAVTGAVTAWDPSVRLGTGVGLVDALAVTDGLVYLAGGFTSAGGAGRSNLAALDESSGAATPWDPAANSEVAALVVRDGLAYIGGFFTSVAGTTRNKVAALRTSDGSATAWNPDATANANVLALAVTASTVYAGGNFASMGGVPRRNVAGLSRATGAPTAFAPDSSDAASGGGVFDLAVSGSTVYAAGFFSAIGGATRHLVAGLRTSDGKATEFDPVGSRGFGAFSLDVATDGTLYVGGSFQTFDRAYTQGFGQFSPVDG